MKMMTNTFIVLAAFYLAICAILYLMQERLLFFPPSPVEEIYAAVKTNEISFANTDEKIHGWKISVNPQATKTILYFGGNAEDVVYFNFEAEKFNAHQAIAVNHPGYGRSSGIPSQQGLYKNSLEVYDYVVNRYRLNPENIIIIGRSLGSSVATYLASQRKSAGLILITPFDSIKNIAANQYKMFPVKLMLKHGFPTIDYIAKVKVPILMMAAEQDEIIADTNLENLNKATGNNSRVIRYPGVGHNTIQSHHEYYGEINRFIESF